MVTPIPGDHHDFVGKVVDPIPVAVPHEMKVATTQIIRSPEIPAMMVEIRAFLSPTIQTWV